MTEAIGFIAGESPLPLLAVREAHRQGKKAVVAAVKNLTVPELAGEADAWAEFSLGQLGAVIRFFKKHGVCAGVDGGPGEAYGDIFHLESR